MWNFLIGFVLGVIFAPIVRVLIKRLRKSAE